MHPQTLNYWNEPIPARTQFEIQCRKPCKIRPKTAITCSKRAFWTLGHLEKGLREPQCRPFPRIHGWCS